MAKDEGKCSKKGSSMRHMSKNKDRAPKTSRAHEAVGHPGMEMGVYHVGFCDGISKKSKSQRCNLGHHRLTNEVSTLSADMDG